MTEKQPNSQPNTDEQKPQAASPAESSASPTQAEDATPATKPAEAPLPSVPGGAKESESVKPIPVSVPPAKPSPAMTSTEDDETLSTKPPREGTPPEPAKKENSDSGTNKIPSDVIAAVKRGPEPPVTSPVPESSAPVVPKTDAPRPPASAQACPNCGHSNRAGIIFCENCGTNLVTGKQPTIGTRDLVKEQEEGDSTGLDTKESQAIKSAGSDTFTDDMVLRIEIEGGLTPMLVYPKVEIIFGRRDPSSGNQPDVDLTGYAGYRMGVSRRHAALRLHDKRLDVSDLGSSNGTFLNGQRLGAHQPYQVRDGDEIRLGQMVLKLFFQATKS